MRTHWGWALCAAVIGGCYLGGPNTGPSDNGAAHRGHSDGAAFDFPEGDAADIDVSAPDTAIRPHFAPTTIAGVRPPPISGGTLLVTKDGLFAIAADPDRDLIYGVDLVKRTLAYTISLLAGDEPGRIAEDGSGRVHVALRNGGALVTFVAATGAVVARRNVCPAPRGVAWDVATDRVWVACSTGELVALPSSGGAATSRFVIERDLRDVIVTSSGLAVSKLRSAEILRINESGVITRRDALPSESNAFRSHVAWRTIPGPFGTLISVHEGASTASILTKVPGGYGGGCNDGMNGLPPLPDIRKPGSGLPMPHVDAGCIPTSGIVTSELCAIGDSGQTSFTRGFIASLAVDVAISRDNVHIAVVAPGNAFTNNLGTIFMFASSGNLSRSGDHVGTTFSEQPIAVAFDAGNNLIVQTREPAELWFIDTTTNHPTSLTLSNISRADTGSDIFHTQAGGMIACASCHPEGQDDGNVWRLDGNLRRTPSLRGTIAGTAPYHWPGDESTLPSLVDDVYSNRMNGAFLDSTQHQALESWVTNLTPPAVPSWIDSNAAAHGESLFTSTSTGCTACHSGPKATNNQTVDVGTGGSFQVPPLVGVGARAPFLHDGCAATLADRFGTCATNGHGSLAGLGAQDITDLATYLETL